MAEPKRIELTSIAPVEKDKKKKPKPKTVRINLTLKESTDTTCPEFSYTELTRNEVGDSSQDGSSTNPFGEEDDDVAAIARKFEEKYAPKPKKGKGGGGVYKDYYEDLVDLGEGYDEDDPFIDNAEAYDEVVPVCMTTTLGGFYINSGALDFKYQSENSQDDFKEETPVKKKKKVQQITSDTDSEGGEKKKAIKKRKLKDGVEGGLKKKKRLLSSDGKKLNKNKLLVKKFKKKSSPTVADLLKDQSASTSPVEMKTNGDGGPGDLKAGGDNPTIGSTIDSLLEQAMKEDSSQDVDEVYKPTISNPEQIPPLPSNISDSLAAIIQKLKAAAKKSGEGKCKFFTSEVNSMLLSIELGTRLLSCGQRSSVYGHLAAFLPCSKDTLLKRVKKLRMNEVDDMLREPMNRLRDAVNKIMPGLLEKYEAECKITALARQEEVGNNNSNNNKQEKEDGSTESDEEEKNTTDNGTDKTKKRIMGPRRKFEWNSEVRNCLLEVVKPKMQCFDILKSRPSPEEHLKAFLESEVRPIWPTGWMQTRTLYKESKSAHSPWTNPQQKVKKAVITSKSFNSPSLTSASVNKTQLDNGVSVNTNNSNVVELSGESKRNNVPTILDYADKVSPTGKLLSNISPNAAASQGISAKPSPKPQGYSDITKVKDTSKHHLVSEMLQKPLSVITGNPSQSSSMMSSPKSPHLTNPNPKDSTFFLEFQKHLSKQLSPTSQERQGIVSQPVSSTTMPHSGGTNKTQFKSPTNKFVETSAKTTSMKTSEALQKQYQSQMNKAHQQARQAATSHQRTEQERMAEIQFQKAFIASVQSSKSSPQAVKQFSPQATTVQSQKVSPTGRDQILAQIQAELVRNDSKIKYKEKTSQNIIEDAVMQQMFKQPLPAANTLSQQKPLLQQALRGSPVSSTCSSPATSSHRQSPVLAHHSPGSRPMTSLLSSPTSRGIVDLTVDSPPKHRTSPTQMVPKKPSPTNLHQSGSTTHQVQRPGYVVTSPASVSKSLDSMDRSKVFLQPHSSAQSQGRMTSLLNTSANNMQAQWNAAFGVKGGNVSAFSPPVNKTVSSSAKILPTDQTKTYYQSSQSPVSVSYKEVYGIQSSPIAAHQGSHNSNSSKMTSGYSHSTPSSPYANPHNHNLLYQQQQHALSPSQLQYSVAAAHLQYQDNSQKHQGQ